MTVCFGLDRPGVSVPDGMASDGMLRVVANALAALAVGATCVVAKKSGGE